MISNNQTDINIPELLSPAGNEECLGAALNFGADAVYIGVGDFSMRTVSNSFSLDNLDIAVKTVHQKGAKLYLACNIIAHNDEIKRIPEILEAAESFGVDALIVSDLGVLSLVKKYAPHTDIHISTQFGVTNYESAQMLQTLGANRIILARELTLDEIVEIRSNISKDLQIECFIHGAMCVSFSGRCLISSYLTGRDANRGNCTQPCRWKYKLVEETRPGIHIPVFEDENGTYLLNAKDLNMIEHLPELARAGINSFKIEGRAKNAYYTAVVTNAYRIAMDTLLNHPAINRKTEQWVLAELKKISHREYCTGYFFDNPRDDAQVFYAGGYIRQWDIAATVLRCENGFLTAIQRNRFFDGDELELLEPGVKPVMLKVKDLQDETGTPLDSASHPMMVVKFRFEAGARENSILRIQRAPVNQR